MRINNPKLLNDFESVKIHCEQQLEQKQYPVESRKRELKESEKNFYEYAEKGTDLYFAGRILCRMGVQTFLFLFHQSIENYLKSFLIFKKNSIPLVEHDLEKLRQQCISEADGEERAVLESKHFELIIKKFNLFFEYSRYPEFRNSGPAEYSLLIPEERCCADLFIYEMRKLLKLRPLKDEGEFGLGFSNRFIVSDNALLQNFLKKENLNFA